MPRDDADYLQQMMDAAQFALIFADGRTQSDLNDDPMFFFALVKAVELIGGAASRVSQDVRELHPQIEWTQIIGMRNRLIHVFYDIGRAILWNVVQHDVPALIPLLEDTLRQQTS